MGQKHNKYESLDQLIMTVKRLFITAIFIILIIDALAWYATYRIATEPSPEAVRMGVEK